MDGMAGEEKAGEDKAGGRAALPAQPATADAVSAFLGDVRAVRDRTAGRAAGGGRLMFALDATGSRQPTWDRAAQVQGEMFTAALGLGGLSVQLCFYRGFGEFMVAPWSSSGADVLRLMTSVTCRAGQTQIGKVLQHAINETGRQRVRALVFVGDCMEENVDHLAELAGRLGLLKVPAFMFHEGGDVQAAFAFREIARLSGGAYCPFDAGSAAQLRDLLKAVAVYAAGGEQALRRLTGSGAGDAVRLLAQMRGR
jgi:hypothetical protein